MSDDYTESDFRRDRANPEIMWGAMAFKHFDEFGTMLAPLAIKYFEKELLCIEEVKFPPTDHVFTIIKLTKNGRLASKLFIEMWDSTYASMLKMQKVSLTDDYAQKPQPTVKFGISRTRLQQERVEGRLDKVILNCPDLRELL